MQGDMLEVMNGIPDKSVDMILTDLPYGTTSNSWDEIIQFDKMWKQYNRVIKDNGSIVLFGSNPFTSKLINSNINNFKHSYVWEKQKASNFMQASYAPLKYHEDIIVFSKNSNYTYNPQKYSVLEESDIEEGFSNKGIEYIKEIIENKTIFNFGKVDRRKNINNPKTNKEHLGGSVTRTRSADNGTRYPKSILRFNRGVNDNVHPTQKPVELLEYLIKTYTNEGDVVLDSTMGSGSTCIAAKNTNRKYIGIELDEEYFKIAKERVNKC